MGERANYSDLIGVMMEYVFSTLSENDILLHPNLYDRDIVSNRICCKTSMGSLWYEVDYGYLYFSYKDESLVDKLVDDYSLQYQKAIYNSFYNEIVKPLCSKMV